jgi:uncharacterized membrane protein HdeD (DUF308 family)
MQIQITDEGARQSSYTVRTLPDAVSEFARFWWVYLLVGIAWIAASLVVLQFDRASVATVGVIIGIMFAVAAAQQFVLAAIAERFRWLWAIFGVLFAAASIVCFIHPQDTFAAFADVLGFLFLCVGVWWTIKAFLIRAVESTWWLELVAGLMMLVVAFWTSGQFFFEKAYTLLVLAGIWALLHGITDIVAAFRLRSAR